MKYGENVEGKYTECYKILAKIGLDMVDLVKNVSSKNVPALLRDLFSLLKDVYDDYKCFSKNGFFQFVNQFNYIKDDRKQCFLDHLYNAENHLKAAVRDLVEFRFSDFTQEFGNVVDILQDAVQ